MAIAFWAVVLAGIVMLFRWLWKFADKIEKEEIEERRWEEYLAYMWSTDPQAAYYWQQQYNARR